MAYKKTHYRNGKKYVYYYESYRDKNGKVRKRYLGSEVPESSRKRVVKDEDVVKGKESIVGRKVKGGLNGGLRSKVGKVFRRGGLGGEKGKGLKGEGGGLKGGRVLISEEGKKGGVGGNFFKRDDLKKSFRNLGRGFSKIGSGFNGKRVGKIFFMLFFVFLLVFLSFMFFNISEEGISGSSLNIVSGVSQPVLNPIGRLTGFVVSQTIDEDDDAVVERFDKEIDLEVKEPVKMGGLAISENKNKRMRFDMEGAGIRLYFDLMNYSEFVLRANEKISEKQSGYGVESGYGIERGGFSNLFSSFFGLIGRVVDDRETGYGISDEDVLEVKEKIGNLSVSEIEEVADDSDIELGEDEFDIEVNESKASEVGAEYKWGYKVKLKELDFIAKIEVTSEKSISKVGDSSLRIGNRVLSFSDLEEIGYSIRFEFPVLSSSVNNSFGNGSSGGGNGSVGVNVSGAGGVVSEEGVGVKEESEESLDESGYGVETGYGITGNVVSWLTGYVVNQIAENTIVSDIEYENKVIVFIERDFGDNVNAGNTSQNKEGSSSNNESSQNSDNLSNTNNSISNNSQEEVGGNESEQNDVYTLIAGVDFEDLDGNGIVSVGDIIYLDPSLIIIPIVDAEELDENRTFIRNVYNETKEKDDDWVLINESHYVRASFEENLTSDKDITVYARLFDRCDINMSDFVVINGTEVSCEIYEKKKRIDELRRLLDEN